MHQAGTQNPSIVIVTGITSGIGLALTRMLCHGGFLVAGTARPASVEKIRNENFLSAPNFMLVQLDLTDSAARKDLVKAVIERWGRVDVLINNAGINYRAVIEEISEEEELHQLEVNYRAPIDLVRLVLPVMRSQGHGRIINVSSVGGMMAMPTMGYYSASKFALEGASEALWYELRPWNIHVSLIEPGFIHSASYRNVLWSKAAQQSTDTGGPYARYYHAMGGFIERLMNRASATPESIARIMMKTIEDPDPPLRIPATLDASFFALLRRWLPRRWYHRLLYCRLPEIEHWVTGRPSGEDPCSQGTREETGK